MIFGKISSINIFMNNTEIAILRLPAEATVYQLNIKNSKIYTDFNEFSLSKATTKISVFVINPAQIYNDFPNFEKIVMTSDLVIVGDLELTIDTVKAIKDISSKFKNVFFGIPGVIHEPNLPVFYINEWFHNLLKLYLGDFAHLLKNLDPYSTKPYYFEFMPGRKKENRVHIYSRIAEYQLQEKIIQTPFFPTGAQTKLPKPGTIDFNNLTYWNSGVTEYYSPDNRVLVNYLGHIVHPQVIISEKIYNDSCYSIVPETEWDNVCSFYTEKIFKPIISKRLFVVFSGQYYLKGLKDLGFQTFDSIIDESYDGESNHYVRWRCAFKEVRRLCQLPQEEILNKIKPIVEYNYQHLIRYNLNGALDKFINDFIKNK